MSFLIEEKDVIAVELEQAVTGHVLARTRAFTSPKTACERSRQIRAGKLRRYR